MEIIGERFTEKTCILISHRSEGLSSFNSGEYLFLFSIFLSSHNFSPPTIPGRFSVMIGTPEYMSPEQVEGKEVDQRSDIYSLGVILYEMVTGRVPFEGDTPFTIGVKHKSEPPRPPKEWNEQIPDGLSRVILKCLEKDKENRYQSVGGVRSDLESIEKGMPMLISTII